MTKNEVVVKGLYVIWFNAFEFFAGRSFGEDADSTKAQRLVRRVAIFERYDVLNPICSEVGAHDFDQLLTHSFGLLKSDSVLPIRLITGVSSSTLLWYVAQGSAPSSGSAMRGD